MLPKISHMGVETTRQLKTRALQEGFSLNGEVDSWLAASDSRNGGGLVSKNNFLDLLDLASKNILLDLCCLTLQGLQDQVSAESLPDCICLVAWGEPDTCGSLY